MTPNQNYIFLRKTEPGVNANKFYEMKANSNGTFTVTYGREGAAKPQSETYPMSMWEKKYSEKTSSKKGYTDVTAYKAVVKTESVKRNSQGQLISKEPEVVKLIQYLQNVSNNLTKANYEVEAKNVTQAQIDDAQKQIDVLFDLTKKFGTASWNLDFFNKELVKLFIIIPRKMVKVADHMISVVAKKNAIDEMLQKEQDLLDSMRSQVVTNNATENETEEEIKNEVTLVETLGLEMSIVTDPKVIAEVKKLAQEHSHKVHRVFKVINKKAQAKFDKSLSEAKNKKTDLLWHGSRAANWISILQSSLLIRPAGAAYTGSMFGDGIYFASESDKSMGYTDSGRWVNGGRPPFVYMALFNVHLGEQHKIFNSDSSLNYNKIKAKGCDSTWGAKGPSLYRNEYIIYRSEQCTISYLIEFKN